MALSQSIERILLPAYGPCPEFFGACTEMRWNPEAGHVPRGFFGASGDPSEVELVLVFAEPGDPHDRERHSGLDSAHDYAGFAFRSGKDLFHRNVRKILEMCWPGVSFEQQMRKVWFTESVLCSARSEGASVGQSSSRACGRRYLLPQLELFPDALIIALGGKARIRLRRLGVTNFLAVFAAAPPGCNRQEARQSWEQIPVELRKRHHRRVRDDADGVTRA